MSRLVEKSRNSCALSMQVVCLIICNRAVSFESKTFNNFFYGGFSLSLCLVGVILGRMENEGEKMMFLVIWLRVEKRRDFGGIHKFSLIPLQNTISPNWRENRSEKLTKIFGQNCPHFLFTFFFLATSIWPK